jgi:hypothetical protein
MKQGYVLGVNICLTTSEDEGRIGVECECLSNNE